MTSEAARALSHAAWWASGSNFATASGDEAVGDDGAEGAVGARREPLVDPPGADQGQGVGLSGDPAGLPGRHLQALDSFPQLGEAVA